MHQPEQYVGSAGAEGEHAQEEREQQQHHALTVEPEHEFLVESIGGDTDRWNGQPNGRQRRSEREVDALLQIVVARSCDGSDPSGSRIRSATSTPANAGGAPIIAVTTSTTSENFFARSTTASKETSSSPKLSASIQFDRDDVSAAEPPPPLMK